MPPNPTGAARRRLRAGGRTCPKLYVLDMFPYPSGTGLHVGHPLGYIGTDVYARYKRMTGHNVIHTMGYDAFGLPAEQYAVETGQHPRTTTDANVANMRRAAPAAGPRPRLPAQRGHHRRHASTGGRSGSSSRSSTAGTTVTPTGPARSPSSRRSWPPAPAPLSPAPTLRRPAVGRARPRSSGARWSTLTASRTCTRHRSTGARGSARCSPTRRSPPTVAPSGATSPCSGVRSSSG